MDKIKESLDRLSELSSEELSALQDDILKEFEAIEGQEPTRENVEMLTQLADAADAVKAESDSREAERAELETAAKDAATRIKAGSESAGDEESPAEVEVDVEVEDPVEDENEPEEVAAEDTEEATEQDETTENSEEEEDSEDEVTKNTENSVDEPEEESDVAETEREMESTVTASANNGELKAPETHEVSPKTEPTVSVAITAGADIPGVSQGSALPDMKSVATAILERKRGMGKTTGGDGEQHTIATFTTNYPESRRLYSSDTAEINDQKIADVASAEAITAAGGVCAPVDAHYDIFKLGDNARPVKDSLPVFNADRGGLRFVPSPEIGDLDGAVAVWTYEDDKGAPANNKVKPCIRVECKEETTVYVDAIPMCMTFGNLGARAWPELVERQIELGMISHARYAETRLLASIGEQSTAVTTEAELGAARDFFVALDTAAAGYRNRNRLDENFELRVLLPEWFKSALRADLVKQLPGNGQDEVFTLAEAQINKWFNARKIAVTWFLDGEEGQLFGAQSAGKLNSYPENLVWYMFAEGTFLFLDGGTLDLGLVRDSQLNGTNDYKIFFETFENVAKVGPESLKVTTPIHIAGASASTVDTIAGASAGTPGNSEG